jgi:hypothetical protein
MSNESLYLQELHHQGKNLSNEIGILLDDYNNISDLFVLAKLKPIIEKKEKRLLELKKEVEEWELRMQP